MARLPISLRLLFLAAVVSTSPAIFARTDKCAAEGLQPCASQGLSDAFCCEANRTCMPLAGKSTVMCCPVGSSCDAIRPITCDVGAQNPDTNLKAPIKTLALASKLPRCQKNDSCCPFGYTCAEDGELCTKNKDQSQAPEGYTETTKGSSSQTTTGVASLSTGTRSASATATTSADPGHAPDPDALGPEKMSIIGGSVGGALALIFITVVIFLCVRSRKKNAASDKSSGSGPYGNMISAPRPLESGTPFRTDFIRKTPSMSSSTSGSSQASRFSGTPRLDHPQPPNSHLSIPNRFDSPSLSVHSPEISRASYASYDDQNARTGQVGARVQPVRGMNPSSRFSRRASTQDVQRDARGENINMFPDASVAQDHNRETCIGGMLEEAGMGNIIRGEPYVPGGR